ncbi:BRCA1-A complex subunit Abraxas 1 [Brienomyrus brachyistius]|uniref:BRCA1-A complex subunit Abraxas 1 n=1 Tax=Brienomyrus brachyistius TaxID=42636 RepID=UPI0020B2AA68|nr:BRCA1-A complex subunit Abraxas 1 [Brienomyrus brachyistius]
MAELHTTVRVSGFVLGSLMFQHFNSDSDAEGFILGETKSEERCKITDSHMDHVQYEYTIHIQKHVSCCRLGSFYDSAGEVRPEEVRRILASEKTENVLGWYKQRRNTDQRMTFKEQVLHRNLRRALHNHELVFLLLTSTDASAISSTHCLEYSVFMSHGSQYHKIPVLVGNLGMLEQQDYWRTSTCCLSSSYSQAVKKHSFRFFTSDGSLKEVSKVSSMNDTLQAQLRSTCKDLEQSERSLERLLMEVSALQKAVAEKRAQTAQCPESQYLNSRLPQENVLLCTAMKVLFPDSPLLRTRVLNHQGVPLPEFCNNDHDIDVSGVLPPILAYRDAQSRRRKRREALETNTEGVLTVSGSDTEDELLASQNGNLDRSNSPVF